MIRTAFDTGAEKVFPNYIKILQGGQKPRFQASKATGELDRKIKEVEEVLKCCELCTRRCGVNRLAGELGFCGVGIRPRIFGAHTHMGEEDELIPSATIFFAGCTMRCAYCQNAPDSITPGLGGEWTEEEVARWIEEEWKEGCRNVNFVGGEPTPYLYSILRSLRACRADIPVVWNSNSYYSEKTTEILKGVVDIYLLDFRYFDERCAVRLSSAPRYPEVAKRNFLEAAGDSELLIRLLVIPEHTECDAKPILKWLRETLGPWPRLNIMGQYFPTWNADLFPEINRRLKREEYRDVVDYAREIGLTNFIVQEQYLR